MKSNPCKKYESALTAKIFGDLSVAAERELNAHLRGCDQCRSFLTEMTDVLGKLGAPQRPVMAEHFWESYWHRLTQRLEKEAPAASASRLGRWREWLRAQWLAQPVMIPFARTASVLALLVFGIMIGHYWWPQNSNTSGPITAVNPPVLAVAQTRAEQWLERSKILLIGVVNEEVSIEAKPDFSHQRLVSRNLLTEARTLNRELDPVADRQFLQLMNQLELILLQIANLETEHDLSSVELVRDGIARDGLLLKINIAELVQQNMAPKKPRQKSPEVL